MPVRLGTRPEHGFDEPLGLLSDCHRRIEHFLGVMQRVLEHTQGGSEALSHEKREALEAAVRYFEVAGPRHTQDEEQSLFPRLRANPDPDVQSTLARLEALEADHRDAERLHAEVGTLCRQWLDAGPLPNAERARLKDMIERLRELYTPHISLEDGELFPLAGRVLSGEQLGQIGREMAGRRGVQPPGTKG